MSTAYSANFDIADLERDLFRAVFKELSVIGEEMREHIRQTMEELDLRARGKLIESVDAMMEATQSALRLEVGPTAEHAPYVLDGAKPHWPPKKDIEDWAQVKFGVSPGETYVKEVKFWDDERGRPVEFQARVNRLQSIVWGVMTKIAREGTAPKDFLTPTIKRFVDEIPERLERRMQAAMA